VIERPDGSIRTKQLFDGGAGSSKISERSLATKMLKFSFYVVYFNVCFFVNI